MAKSFFNELKGFMIKPAEYFDTKKKSTVGEAMIYGVKGLLILAVLLSIVSAITATLTIGSAWGLLVVPFVLIAVPAGGFVGSLIMALWLHLWAYVFGAKEGVENTIKIVFYGSTPSYLLGWIPFGSFIASIWNMVLYGVGLKHLQKMPTNRAVAAIIVAVVIPIIIAIIAVIYFLATFGNLLESAGTLY